MVNIHEYVTEQMRKLDDDSLFALVTYDNKTEPILFHLYGDMGHGVFLAHSPCNNPTVICTFTEEQQKNIKGVCVEGILPGLIGVHDKDICEKFFDDFVKDMIIDGVLYEVTAFQCVPWLPDLADEVKILTEGEMLRWLLKNKQE